MKVLIHSNAPFVGSGYGQQTALAVRALDALGHERAVSASYGLAGNVLNLNGTLIIPGAGANDGFGVKQAPVNGKLWGADILVTLLDAWVFEGKLFRDAGQRWVALAPVDHEPIPRRVREKLAEAWWPAAMCRHGEAMMRDAGLDPLYLPHAYDPAVMKPLSTPDRMANRAKLHIPEDAFVVGMVAANKGQPSRKSIPTVVEAFAGLHQKHPDAVLALHMEMDARHQGVNVFNCLEFYGVPESAVRYSDQRAPSQTEQHMASLFASLDVLVNPSMGEGFGVPILEAAACGTPAIVGDWTAMPEVAGTPGWAIPREESLRVWTVQESYQFMPSASAIFDRLEAAYAEHGTNAALVRRNGAADHALAWRLEAATEAWRVALERVAERIEAEGPMPEPMPGATDAEPSGPVTVEVRT